MEKELMAKIRPGAKVRVWERIKEGEKERESAFEGLVIARKHGSEAGATFTVRAILQSIGTEKIFPFFSPMISKVEVLSTPKKVHRSKLYFLRKLSARQIREKLGASI